MNPGLIKAFIAQGAITPKSIVAAGTLPGTVKLAEDGDSLLGLSDVTGAVDGGLCDVILTQIGEVKLGGAVAFGAKVATDGSGTGITGDVASASIGIALDGGVAGDIIPLLIERNPAVTPA